MRSLTQFVAESRNLSEEKDLKTEYEAVFTALLDKFGVKSPAELSDDKKSEFFGEISKYYTAGKGQTAAGEKLAK
jgi:hypothetical protein